MDVINRNKMNVPKQEIQQININGITINDPLKIANEFMNILSIKLPN